MRHNKKIKHLGRTSAHRKSMLSNMAASLIMHKRIFTTVPKAKALKKVVEPVITRSKVDTTHSRRIAFRTLQNKEAINELFQNVSQKVADRPGGYTRILRTGRRLGDNAPMCFIELVDYNENMLKDTAAPTRRRRRRRRKSSGDATTASTPETVESNKTDVESKSDVEDVKSTEDIQSEDDESKTEKE